MHPYPQYFPQRGIADNLDCVSLLASVLSEPTPEVVLQVEAGPITRQDIARHVGALQRWFARQGLAAGDRVAIMLGNEPAHVFLIYALVLSGLVWVPVNTKLRRAGLEHLLRDARPRICIVAHDHLAMAEDIDWGGRLATPPAVEPKNGDVVRVHPSVPRDPLCIIYTSGTTGAPKGVVFTHRMMRIASEAALRVADANTGDRLFLWEPLCHIGGAQLLMLPFMARVSLYLVPRFSASQFWAQIAQARATHLHYLGGILDILMRVPASARPATHSLRVAWGAGVSANAWEATRIGMGVRLRECYGMTECSSFATLNDRNVPGSIGRPLPWIHMELIDEHGQPAAPGSIGEIVLSSTVDGVFLPGYLDNAEATRSTLRHGKLHTGDSGRRDAEGNYYFVGRLTDSMRVRGENVSAWEVERVFAAHPAIEASAAVGVASAVGEQEILLFVQFKVAPLGWDELNVWAAERLPTFQRPRFYRSVEQFEMTPSERIKKHLLPRDTEGAWDRDKPVTGR